MLINNIYLSIWRRFLQFCRVGVELLFALHATRAHAELPSGSNQTSHVSTNTTQSSPASQPNNLSKKGKIKVYFYSPELRSDRSQSPEVVYRPTKNYSLGYQKDRIHFGLEYQEFSDNSAAGVTQIFRSHQELLAWLNYHYAQYNHINFYAGIGGGAYRETVTTHFNKNVYVDPIPTQPLFALNAGAELRISIFDAKDLILAAAEVQTLFGETLDPAPSIGLVFRAGISF